MRPHIRRLLESAGFSPRQLFAALQGAWLEPTPGYIWQEDTGVTPTTTGGQTIGLMLDQSQGAVLGPELVSNGDFSDGTTGWAQSRGGTLSVEAGALRGTGTGGTQIGAATTVSATVGRMYRFSCSYSAGTSSTGILLRAASDQNLGTPALDVTYASGSGSFVGYFFATAATMYVGCLSIDTVAGRYIEIDNVSVREILGNHAYQSVSGSRPTYQLDSNGLPLARHDTTDSLSVSLPAINVRRNLLYYSDRFNVTTVIAGSTWALFGTTAVYNTKIYGGLTGSTFTPSGTNAYFYRTSTGPAILAAGTYTFSFFAAGTSIVNMGVYDEGLGYWQGITVQLTTTPTRYTFTATVATNTQQIGVGRLAGLGGSTAGAFDLYYMQVEAGSTATDYQKVTDWTSEAYSSNGSVYFATPVGMSSLHNQSMGTTYTLPALSSDIYSWIVVPQRLSAVQESRLERYMLRKAGLVEPDYLLDDNGNQLMSDDYELLLRQ